MRKTAMPREALRNVNSIAKLLKSTEFPDRFVVSEWDFPKLDVVGSNPIARFQGALLGVGMIPLDDQRSWHQLPKCEHTKSCGQQSRRLN